MKNCYDANCGSHSLSGWNGSYGNLVQAALCSLGVLIAFRYMYDLFVCMENNFFISDNGYRRCLTFGCAVCAFCYPRKKGNFAKEMSKACTQLSPFVLVCSRDIQDNWQILTTRLLVWNSKACQSQREKVSIKFSLWLFSEMRLLIRIYLRYLKHHPFCSIIMAPLGNILTPPTTSLWAPCWGLVIRFRFIILRGKV